MRPWASRVIGVGLVLGVQVASLTWLTACNLASAMSADEVQHHGVMMFRQPAPKVFKSSIEALKQLGYEIKVEEADKGLIVTNRRSLPDLSAANNAAYTKQYTLEVRDVGGAARVTATPAIFENDVDVSSKKVWDLESPLGEREVWRQLFAKIEQLL